jgi:hypothetical protein
MRKFRKNTASGPCLLAAIAMTTLACAQAPGAAPANAATPPGPGGKTPTSQSVEAPHTLTAYFMPSTSVPKSPDADGFLQRWLLLEPINKPNRSNSVFTDTYVREAFKTEYFPNQFNVVPRDGDQVKVGDQQLSWHALDSRTWNVRLFRLAYGLNKQTYGVLFWAVTIVNSPREIEDVRMAVGSNSASMWWLNGQEAVDLFDDRRMVMDDVVSKRLTLHKGQNILRGAVINGPGLSDFCVRFLDHNGDPVKGITLTTK